MEKTAEKTHRTKRYQDKVKARWRIAHRYNLPDMPWPALIAKLETRGIDTDEIEANPFRDQTGE